MKIESSSVDTKSRTGSMRLTPNNSDDIYYLSSIVVPGDKVSCYTTRKLSLDGGKTQKKITLRLEVRVESIESDLDVGIMYVKGKTSCEHEHVRIGSYHTLDISIGEEFTLTKARWEASDMKRIAECAKEIPEICFIMFYDRDCVVSTVSSNDIKIVYKGEVKSKNFKELLTASLKLKPRVKNFIIASISDVRNDFYKSLIKEDNGLSKITSVLKLTPDYKGLPNSKVISKVLSDKNLVSVFNNVRFVDDIREMQNFFVSMSTSKENVCIGIREVAEAIDYGAIKTLFVTDRFCKPRSVGERAFADGFISKATEMRAKVCVIPVALELGEKLKDIGSVACTLSFNYK